VATHGENPCSAIVFGNYTQANLTKVSEPERLRAPWINGIKHWYVRYA
jgi:hypothetical protein